MKTVAILLSLVLLVGTLTPVFAKSSSFESEIFEKSITNYTLDDIAFKICTKEYEIYEKAGSMHMGDPKKLSQWTDYTNCHDDAFLVLRDTTHLCAEQIEIAEISKMINDGLEWNQRQMSESRMIHEYEKAWNCQANEYYNVMDRPKPQPTPQEPTGFKEVTETPLKIECGKGTADINGICQVEKQPEPQKKPKKSFDFFEIIFKFFGW